MGTNEGEEEEEEGEGEFVIPPEQYEQDMQAEDEQYIQAGTEGLSGQQVGSLFNSPGDIKSPFSFSKIHCNGSFSQCLQLNTFKKD